MKTKFQKYLLEAKVKHGDVEFESIKGAFSGLSKLVKDTKEDETWNFTPGVSPGSSKKVYKIKLDGSKVDMIEGDIMKVYKKIGDTIDKMMVAELKKLGFKRR